MSKKNKSNHGGTAGTAKKAESAKPLTKDREIFASCRVRRARRG
jgi:hypothetical protein